MLDKDFILKIANEKINNIKNLNLENLDPRLSDPSYNWIQNDPTNVKKEFIFSELNKRIVLLTNNIEDQKRYTKKFLYTSVRNLAQLFFIVYVPINNQPLYLYPPFSKLTTQQSDRFLLFLTRDGELLSKEGITSEKSFYNCALIAQLYSVNNFLCLIFQELLLNLGENNIRNITNTLRKNMVNEVVNFVKVLDENGNVDLTKISIKYKITAFLNKKFEDEFLK
jgi:hypothetical protein